MINEQSRIKYPSSPTEMQEHATETSDYYEEEIMTVFGAGIT